MHEEVSSLKEGIIEVMKLTDEEKELVKDQLDRLFKMGYCMDELAKMDLPDGGILIMPYYLPYDDSKNPKLVPTEERFI